MNKASITNREALIINGPTCSGKSAIALEIAKEKNGIIINADSMQFYKDIPIISAQPSKYEQTLSPHFLFGILNMESSMNAVMFTQKVKQVLDENPNKFPIIVGGTGLYIKILTEGISKIPNIDKSVEDECITILKEEGLASIYKKLQLVDAETKIMPTDTQRIIRAYSVWLATGKNITYWQSLPKEKVLNDIKFQVKTILPERSQLYSNCEKRFDEMINNGALEEAKYISNQLYKLGLTLDDNKLIPLLNAIGVKYLVKYIRGEINLTEAITKSKQETRNYAKRQYTWFKWQQKLQN